MMVAPRARTVAELEALPKPPPSVIDDPEIKCFVLLIRQLPDQKPREFPGRYEIDWERCNTTVKLIGWIYHVLPKTWVTKQHIWELMTLVSKRFPSIPLYKGA